MAAPTDLDAGSPLGPMVAPSPWIARFAALVPDGATVVDVAAGAGRHTRLFRRLGHPVVAVDRDVARLSDLRSDASVEVIAHDLEAGGWPLAARAFGAVVVANYLWRPLFPALLAALAPGGALLYESFAEGNARFGRPSNPDFLLRPGELLALARGRLRVVAFEEGAVGTPRPAAIQRIAALAPGGETTPDLPPPT